MDGSTRGVLKNAIDYLHNECPPKPVGFVGYGGVSAGTRAVQMTKQVVTTLKMTPVQRSGGDPLRPPSSWTTRCGDSGKRDHGGGPSKAMLDVLALLTPTP